LSTDALFHLPNAITTHWASSENLDAKAGSAGQSNFGRKGSPSRKLAAGEEFVMAHADGMGTIRRFWITIDERTPQMLRGLVLRIYWDHTDKPAVEVPLGDFFGCTLGRMETFENAWFDTAEGRSFNCRLPMPFQRGFSMTVTNESPRDLAMFFYDVNFTLGDNHGEDTGYFHAHYRRENPTKLRHDFEILPHVTGRGRFLGCSLGVIADTARYGKAWWGEGEVKVYLDGDTDLPTLCGTGTEDYIGTGWGQGRYDTLWQGCPLADEEHMQYGFYRLHGPDPVYFAREIRVTIQQIGGAAAKTLLDHMRENDIPEYVTPGDGTGRLTQDQLEASSPDQFYLIEREDDWCATAYFYLDSPVSALAAIDSYNRRVAKLT